jgi:hypothetical protein
MTDEHPQAQLTFATKSARSRHRNGFKRAVSVLLATMSTAVIGRYLFDPQWPNSENLAS